MHTFHEKKIYDAAINYFPVYIDNESKCIAIKDKNDGEFVNTCILHIRLVWLWGYGFNLMCNM